MLPAHSDLHTAAIPSTASPSIHTPETTWLPHGSPVDQCRSRASRTLPSSLPRIPSLLGSMLVCVCACVHAWHGHPMNHGRVAAPHPADTHGRVAAPHPADTHGRVTALHPLDTHVSLPHQSIIDSSSALLFGKEYAKNAHGLRQPLLRRLFKPVCAYILYTCLPCHYTHVSCD